MVTTSIQKSPSCSHSTLSLISGSGTSLIIVPRKLTMIPSLTLDGSPWLSSSSATSYYCGGKGGQNVNKVETGVRIIHIPTGIVALSTEERSQFLNKQRAMEKLQEKLADLQKEQEAKLVNAAWREQSILSEKIWYGLMKESSSS